MIERANDFAPVTNGLIAGFAVFVGGRVWKWLGSRSVAVRLSAALGAIASFSAAAVALKTLL
jgi:hypothetical protein